MPALRMTGSEWGLLLALSALWGGSFFFAKVAVGEWPPLTVAFCRVALAAATLWAVIAALRLALPRDGRAWGRFLVMGLLNNAVPFALIFWAQTRIESGLASILNATTPLFTVVLAAIATSDERLTASRAAGVVFGLAGVAIMVGPDAWAGLGADAVAQAACLAGAVSYAAAGIYGRRFRRLGVAPLITAAGQLAASTGLLLILAVLVDRPWTLPPPSGVAIAAVGGLALLSTALAYVLYFRILATAGATNLLLVTFLIPVSALLLGAVILGETVESEEVGGMALIGLGLAAIDGRLIPRRR